MSEAKFKVGQNVIIFHVGALPEEMHTRQVLSVTPFPKGSKLKYMGAYHIAKKDLFMYAVSGMEGYEYPEFNLREVAA